MRSDAEAADVTPNQELEVLVQIDAETAADHGINPKLPSGDIRTDGRDKVPKVWGWRFCDESIQIWGHPRTSAIIDLSLSHHLAGGAPP